MDLLFKVNYEGKCRNEWGEYAIIKPVELRKVIGIYLSLGLILVLALVSLSAAQEKETVGEVEEVILLPWNVRLPARVDTGAAMTSLDARNLEVMDNVAFFKLAKKYGGTRFSVPIKGWKVIRSASGRQKRPIVELEFCIGSKRVFTEVNLTDRKKVKYPVLLGRNVLKDQFVIDCTKTFCAPPRCPDTQAR